MLEGTLWDCRFMLMIVKAWVSIMSPAWIEDADIDTSVRGVVEEPKMHFEVIIIIVLPYGVPSSEWQINVSQMTWSPVCSNSSLFGVFAQNHQVGVVDKRLYHP